MRFFTPLSLALVASPAVVTAAKGTLGFALGTKKPDGSCKGQGDYEADFDAIKGASGSTLVRGYAASDCNCAQYILPAAKAKGARVILGIWPDTPESFNLDMSAIQKYAPQFSEQVYAVTVGSETMYRKNFTGAQLLDKINEVRGKIPKGIKVGTADSWNKFADGTADAVIAGKPDILLVNAFGFWQAQTINNATHQFFDDEAQAYTHIQKVAGSTDSIELWVGETGWPGDGGSDYGAAKAGTANAKTYYEQGVCGMINWGYNVFSFEAFDEPWKPASVGDNGKAADETHWGVMTSGRRPKYSLKC